MLGAWNQEGKANMFAYLEIVETPESILKPRADFLSCESIRFYCLSDHCWGILLFATKSIPDNTHPTPFQEKGQKTWRGILPKRRYRWQ